MKSLHLLARHWDSLGRPSPSIPTDQETALRHARLLIASAEPEATVVFEVRSQLDQECIYALARLATSSAGAEKDLATRLLQTAEWPGDEFGELDELRASLSRSNHGVQVAEGFRECLTVGDARSDRDALRSSVERRTPISQPAHQSHESLFAACEVLKSRVESAPAAVRAEAETCFELAKSLSWEPDEIGDRNALLGELAMLAGCASRLLFQRNDAHRWFAIAERFLAESEMSSSNLARLEYQRLAIAVEERRFDEVMREAPILAIRFEQLGLPQEALKCLFLEGNILRETGNIQGSVDVFQRICRQAEISGNIHLLAIGLGTLAMFLRINGDLKQAIVSAKRALPLLQQTDNRVNLAKLRWCVGDILREQGNGLEALASYRSALLEAEEIGMRWDAVALHLVIAELLLEVGQEREAEQEVRAALPIIDEEQMVPEGMAALGLLRESLRRRKLDRGALRDLHGYFPKS